MRTSVTLDDEMFEELMEITDETNRTRAVQTAVEHFVRAARLDRLRSLKGKVATLDNEEIETGELDEPTSGRG
jgi:Arc/MetJ family transcription regulator